MNRDLKVHDDLKHFFRKPAGRLLPGLNKKTVSLAKSASSGSFTILVGDSASHLLLNNGMNPDVIITDGFVKRKKFIKKIKFSGLLIRAKNPRGWITKSLWQAVAKAIGSGEPVRIQVDGEEDLAVLPAIIMAPEGSSILYGQPTEGLVYIKVDGKRRANAVKILKAIQKANQT
jgi:uncharacterized protein (UPF0218 family)